MDKVVSFHQGTLPLLVSIPHAGLRLTPAVEAGLVDEARVEAALQLQKASPEAAPRRLGEVLVDMGSVTRDQIQEALQTQQRKREMAARAAVAAERLAPAPSLAAGDREVGVDGQTLARMINLIDRLATRS